MDFSPVHCESNNAMGVESVGALLCITYMKKSPVCRRMSDEVIKLPSQKSHTGEVYGLWSYYHLLNVLIVKVRHVSDGFKKDSPSQVYLYLNFQQSGNVQCTVYCTVPVQWLSGRVSPLGLETEV